MGLETSLVHLEHTSALPLDWEKPADDTRYLTFQERRKFSVVDAMTSGPPSVESSSGTSNVEKNLHKWWIRPTDPPRLVPVVVLSTSTQPERRSPMIK